MDWLIGGLIRMIVGVDLADNKINQVKIFLKKPTRINS